MRRLTFGATLLALLAFAGVGAASGSSGERWVATFFTSQQIAEGNNQLPPEMLKDATLRQVVRVHIGGDRIRIRFSNAFGTAPLRIGKATVGYSADPATSKVRTEGLRALSFNGADSTVVPAGADYWSDPVPLPVQPGDDLAVTLHLPEAPARQTGHAGSRATSYHLRGEHVAAAELAGAATVDRWYLLSGVETVSARGSAVVVLGDSITDGYGVKPNTNSRWTDFLSARLRADPKLKDVAVLNAGIGGGRLLLDGVGPNALARFDRDVLSAPGVTHLIVLIGVNDLGTLTRDAPVSEAEHHALVARMIGAYRQIAARARARGIKVIGATVLPYGGSGYYHPDALNIADWQAVNAWIRKPGNFDAVIDFATIIADPARPTQLLARYDSGDGLHPSIDGYRAMAERVPLAVLRR